jgi:hypothetical protein
MKAMCSAFATGMADSSRCADYGRIGILKLIECWKRSDDQRRAPAAGLSNGSGC